MAILCIHRVCESYKGSKDSRPAFRPHAAITYDARTMSFERSGRTSLLTLSGRMSIPYLVGGYYRERMKLAKKQADLVLRKDGKWFLLLSVVVPERPLMAAVDLVGVDMGVVNVATDSDGTQYSGKIVESVRKKHNLQRKRLQKKGTKGAKKKLRRVSGKEANFRRHENHVISKRVVESAKGTSRGIALEELRGIRERLTVWGRETRNRLSGWSFAQLRGFIEYKAKLAGVPVIMVSPRNTSRTCAACGHCDKNNRKTQSDFLCVSCGHTANADVNAARNIRALGIRKLPTELAGVIPQSENFCL